MKQLKKVVYLCIFLTNLIVLAQQWDYTDNLYLPLGSVENVQMSGNNSPYVHPSDAQYQSHVWTDVNKLRSIPYGQKFAFPPVDLRYWITFGGFGDANNSGQGFQACVDNGLTPYIANSTFITSGKLAFKNIKIPGQLSTWGTSIWINIFSQCHDGNNQGYWWKFEKNLTADEARRFAASHEDLNSANEYVNGVYVHLSLAGTPSCNPSTTYQCQ
ncbi:hypothetical protein [Tenacibaculum agarivorans]|uniref:hypothetical protein n=1 Tax=Tenacibaculum agarivorans TaxID=1908389 RepID=UPI00094BB89D|nr:hypothetical protein [Tenacibaculum agarivorans]